MVAKSFSIRILAPVFTARLLMFQLFYQLQKQKEKLQQCIGRGRKCEWKNKGFSQAQSNVFIYPKSTQDFKGEKMPDL